MSLRPRILITEPKDFSSRARAMLQERCDLEEREVDERALAAGFLEFDAVWIRLAHRITVSVLGGNPRCKVLACPATGLDHIDVEACGSRGVRVISLKGETAFLQNVRATAELTIGLMLAVMRKIPEASVHVRGGGWDRDQFRGSELYEKTVGIVGVGRLGRLVARTLRAMGSRVIGFDPRPDFPHDEVDRRAETLEELLRESDVVSLHVSYDDSTRHLIDTSALALMKSGAFLVNTSRGGIIDDGAVLRALESGRLAGAALDVVDGEPDIDKDHRIVRALLTHPNLLVTPHIGGATYQSLRKVEDFIARKVLDAFSDAPVAT